MCVVIAGNQTVKTGGLLRGLSLPVDFVATSGEWGVAKPSREFFTRVIDASGAPAYETVYVGDHPADDITPAAAAGLLTAHLRRGPWGYLWADRPQAAAADWRIDSLFDLVSVVEADRSTE